MEKTLRVLGGDEEGEGSAHSHSHSHSASAASTAAATGVDNMLSPQNGLRKRSSDPDNSGEPKPSSINQAVPTASATGPSKLSAYLNLFGDFVHNM